MGDLFYYQTDCRRTAAPAENLQICRPVYLGIIVFENGRMQRLQCERSDLVSFCHAASAANLFRKNTAVACRNRLLFVLTVLDLLACHFQNAVCDFTAVCGVCHDQIQLTGFFCIRIKKVLAGLNTGIQ